MSFSIRLGADMVAAEAGATTPVSVVVENRAATSDRFEMEIQGIDTEWMAVPVPVFAVGAGETCTERFFFRPPRNSESTAGNYPFVVRVRSLDTGDVRQVQGVLEIRPFHHISMEINPKRGMISPAKNQNVFSVMMVNLGNTEHNLRLQANDPEDALTFEFEPDSVTLGPGQQKEAELVAVPTSTRIVSGARLIGFSVTGRSSEISSVATSTQGQLEQRFWFSPTSLATLLVAFLLAALWFVMMPKPPQVQSFSVSPQEVEMGQPVTITWSVPDASTVRIFADGASVTESTQKQGEYTYTTSPQGDRDQIRFEIVAERNGRKSEPVHAVVQLRKPEVVPPPTIRTLSVDRRRVKLGEPFVLSYKFGEAVEKAVLSPDNTQLDPQLPSISVTPRLSGKQTYTVVAYNKAGKTVSKSFSVEVYDESDASIISFVATPKQVPATDGKTTLTWSVLRAARITIKAGETLLDVDQNSTNGSVDVPVTAKTTFTLTAYDENGKPVTQTQTVTIAEVAKPEDPSPDDPPPVVPPSTTPPPVTDPGTGTTGGGTGGR